MFGKVGNCIGECFENNQKRQSKNGCSKNPSENTSENYRHMQYDDALIRLNKKFRSGNTFVFFFADKIDAIGFKMTEKREHSKKRTPKRGTEFAKSKARKLLLFRASEKYDKSKECILFIISRKKKETKQTFRFVAQPSYGSCPLIGSFVRTSQKPSMSLARRVPLSTSHAPATTSDTPLRQRLRGARKIPFKNTKIRTRFNLVRLTKNIIFFLSIQEWCNPLRKVRRHHLLLCIE